MSMSPRPAVLAFLATGCLLLLACNKPKPDSTASGPATTAAVGSDEAAAPAVVSDWRLVIPLRTVGFGAHPSTLEYPEMLQRNSLLRCDGSRIVSLTYARRDDGDEPTARLYATRDAESGMGPWRIAWPTAGGPDDAPGCAPPGAVRRCSQVFVPEGDMRTVAFAGSKRCWLDIEIPKAAYARGDTADGRDKLLSAAREAVQTACPEDAPSDWQEIPEPLVAEHWSCSGEGLTGVEPVLVVWYDQMSGNSSAPVVVDLEFRGEGAGDPADDDMAGWLLAAGSLWDTKMTLPRDFRFVRELRPPSR